MRDGPSVTARAVALARARLERPQTPEGNPAAEDRLSASLPRPMWWPLFGGVWRRRIAARTPFFDDVMLAAIHAGITQVVILGAGYDGRALFGAGQLEGLLKQAGWKTIQHKPAVPHGELRGILVLAQ